MATVQKSSLRRYNGTDWDSVFFSTASDIVSLGNGITVAELTTAPFKVGDVLENTDNMFEILKKIVNRVATYDAKVLPGLANGSGITSVSASAITGTIDRSHLPADVGGKGVPVDTEAAREALTPAQVNIGDIVKVKDGGVYLVSSITTEGETSTINYLKLTDDAAQVAWSRITGTPTTVAGYGITDALTDADTAAAGGETAAGKVPLANDDGKLAFDITGDAATLDGHNAAYFATADALTATNAKVTSNDTNIKKLQEDIADLDASAITKGVLSLDRIPKAAIENVYVVANAAALATLTSEQVQNGDTIKIADTETTPGMMYYVVDVTKLGTDDYMEGLMVYTAGRASAVDWSGVLSTPTTLAGYGITDAVASSMVVDEAAPGKLLKLNAQSKLDADITGDAATLGGHDTTYYATAANLTTTNTTVAGHTTDIAALKAALGIAGEGETPIGIAKDVADLKAVVGTATTENTILYNIEKLKSGDAITALAASKLTGTIDRSHLPTDVGGKIITKADMAAAKTDLTADNTNVGDLVKLANGQVWGVVDTTKLNADDGYVLLVDVAGTDISWSKITGTPTTLAGYGITDAVNTNDVIVNGLATDVDVGGKIVKLNSTDKKLHANIAGDAMSLNGHADTYFATDAALKALSVMVPIAVNSLDELENPQVGQMVMLPITTTANP